MNWVSTPDSTAIEGFGYDPARRTLEIRFKHGKTYVYFKVPEAVFEQMQAAESKGQFVTEHVKGSYEFQDKRDVGRAKRDLVRPHVRVRFPREKT
jgi:hypothetical protein